MGLCGSHGPPYRIWGVVIGLRGSPGTSYRIWGGAVGLYGAHNPIIGYGVWI